jgi:hypothetical protein
MIDTVHKGARCVRIAAIERFADGSADLTPAEAGGAPIKVSRSYMQDFKPFVGGRLLPRVPRRLSIVLGNRRERLFRLTRLAGARPGAGGKNGRRRRCE